jgi:hypothetical protein
MCKQLHSSNDDNKSKNKINTIVYIHAPFTVTIQPVMYPYTTVMYPYTTAMYPYTTAMYPYTTVMYSYTTVMHPYTTVMYSYTTVMYPYTTVMYPYTTVMYPYTTVMYPYTTPQQLFNSVCHKILSHNLVQFHVDTLSNNIYVHQSIIFLDCAMAINNKRIMFARFC